MTTIVVTRETAHDLHEASSWLTLYASLDIARQFAADFDIATQSIAVSPESFPIYDDSIRRLLLDRFRYSVYYEYDSEEYTVVILAVIHQSRHPRVAANGLEK